MTTGIIDGVPTTAYQLFHSLFPVKIQNMFLISDKERQHRPGYNHEDPNIAAQTRSETVTVYRTPVAMTLLYDKGIIPYIVDRHDLLKIYELITQHLNDWASEIRNPVSNLTPPPPLDLLQLESFAQYIYEDAMFEKETLLAQGRVGEHDNTIADFLAMFGGRAKVTELRSVVVTEPERLNKLADAWDAITWTS